MLTMLYIKKKNKVLVVASKKICLEANAEKIKYTLMAGHQSAG